MEFLSCLSALPQQTRELLTELLCVGLLTVSGALVSTLNCSPGIRANALSQRLLTLGNIVVGFVGEIPIAGCVTRVQAATVWIYKELHM